MQRTQPSQHIRRPDTAGTNSHQTSTADASSMIHDHLLTQSRQIVNDAGLHGPYHDHLYGHQLKIVIVTYTQFTQPVTIKIPANIDMPK